MAEPVEGHACENRNQLREKKMDSKGNAIGQNNDRAGIEGLTAVDESEKPRDAHREPGDAAEPDLEDGDEIEVPALAEQQAPARMKSPDRSEAERAAADALVQEGITREQAEQLVSSHGTDWETLKSAAWPEKMKAESPDVDAQESDRKSILREHHEEGIPPFEPPGLKE